MLKLLTRLLTMLTTATAVIAQTNSSLDFEVFKSRIQPVFMAKRPGRARCYVCHSTATNFRLQRLSTGATSWDEEQSRRNFAAVQRLVTPGNPLASRLLTHPLAAEAGGDPFHSGGKHWDSQTDPEWRAMAEWVQRAAK